jgi:cytoskeletal protein CcmA (bactofilin family)
VPGYSTEVQPSASLSAFIDQGSEFEGKLTFKDTVRIDGCFRGEITSQNTLIVGETGEIMATVRSREVIVSGSVTGNVFASDRLVLHKTARVEGDVEAGTIAIEEGAILNGKVTMGGSRTGGLLK